MLNRYTCLFPASDNFHVQISKYKYPHALDGRNQHCQLQYMRLSCLCWKLYVTWLKGYSLLLTRGAFVWMNENVFLRLILWMTTEQGRDKLVISFWYIYTFLKLTFETYCTLLSFYKTASGERPESEKTTLSQQLQYSPSVFAEQEGKTLVFFKCRASNM